MDNNIFSLAEETRCEFVVSKKQKKVWKTQMDMALEVKRICEKYKIKYFIIWGTLLGAVRHKGYIPWDDDFDIAFMRKDYERFCKIARKEITSPLFFQDALSDREFFIGYARIRDSRTTGWILDNSSPRYNNGIFIDLYPLDVIPENAYVRKMQSFMIRRVLKGLIKYNISVNKDINGIRYRLLVFFHKLFCTIFDGVKNPKKIGAVYSPDEMEMGYWFYARDVKETVQLAFENISLAGPKGYRRVLKNVYGDYMEFPPIGKRGKWHERQIIFEPDIPYSEFYKNKMRRRKK